MDSDSTEVLQNSFHIQIGEDVPPNVYPSGYTGRLHGCSIPLAEQSDLSHKTTKDSQSLFSMRDITFRMEHFSSVTGIMYGCWRV